MNIYNESEGDNDSGGIIISKRSVIAKEVTQKSDDPIPLRKTKKKATTDIKSFSYLEDGTISYSILNTLETLSYLKSGAYELKYIDANPPFVRITSVDHIEKIRLYNFKYKDKLDKYIRAFFNTEVSNFIKSFGFLHKVGILLYGQEGTGKTTQIKQYCNELIENNNAIVFYITNNFFSQTWEFIKNLRTIHDNPFVIVIDEIDYEINHYESAIKNALDGYLSIDNCIVFASTNYIDKIPRPIRNRPSRFKFVLEVKGIETVEEVEYLINNLLQSKFTQEEIREFATEMEGQTLDSIKQFCLDKIMDVSIEKIEPKTIGFKNKGK